LRAAPITTPTALATSRPLAIQSVGSPFSTARCTSRTATASAAFRALCAPRAPSAPTPAREASHPPPRAPLAVTAPPALQRPRPAPRERTAGKRGPSARPRAPSCPRAFSPYRAQSSRCSARRARTLARPGRRPRRAEARARRHPGGVAPQAGWVALAACAALRAPSAPAAPWAPPRARVRARAARSPSATTRGTPRAVPRGARALLWARGPKPASTRWVGWPSSKTRAALRLQQMEAAGCGLAIPPRISRSAPCRAQAPRTTSGGGRAPQLATASRCPLPRRCPRRPRLGRSSNSPFFPRGAASLGSPGCSP
jgi:hypothetical protein